MKLRPSSRHYLPGVASAAVLMALVGCGGKKAEPAPAAPVTTNVPPAQPVAPTRVSRATPVPAGMVGASLALPTGQEETSVILVESWGPAEIQAGAPFDYTIKATNLTDKYELRNTVITQEIPGTYTIRSSEPQVQTPAARPSKDGYELVSFFLGTINPSESKTITVNAVASQEGNLEICTTADYDLYVCWASKVVRPNVSVTKTGPEEVIICDPIPYQITVKNEGTGAARNLVVTDKLPDGLTANGQSTVTFDVGTLNAGESKNFTVDAKATQSGSFVNVADVTGDGIVAVSNPVTTRVTKPNLEITKTAPEADYLNARFDYTITVRNTGDAVAKDAKVVDNLPSGVEFISATDGGSASGNTVTWTLGDMAPGATKTFVTTVRGKEKGTLRNTAEASAYCTDNVTASVITEIVGIPAVLLEVIDTEDPVKVGQDTTYEIKVTNQGSEDITNLKLDAILEKETFISIAGPSDATVEGELIKIAPIATLPAGQNVTWTIKVTGTDVGDVRFRVNMVADQIDRPVRETESTHIYKEGEVKPR